MSWFDLQVNGYGGVDFNQDDLKESDLHQACVLLQTHGLRGILATVISDSSPKMESRLRRLVSLRAADPLIREMIRGIHIEGPFLNPSAGYRGAHPAAAICPAEIALTGRLLEAGGGLVRLFTLAPEQDPTTEICRFLVKHGVVVSAGHTDAPLDVLQRAIEEGGLSMFTHLGNGCPMQLPRHDNIVQRALALRKHLHLCFIADGIHIPFFALRNYFDLIDPDKIIVTTDAISAAGMGPGQYRLGNWEVTVGSDLAVRSPDKSHLIGSAVPMPALIENLRKKLHLDEATITKVAGLNAERVLFPK